MKKKLFFAMIMVVSLTGTAAAQTGRTEMPVVEGAPSVAPVNTVVTVMSKLTPLNLSEEQKGRALEVVQAYYPNGLKPLSKVQVAQRDQAIETLLYPHQVEAYRNTVVPTFVVN